MSGGAGAPTPGSKGPATGAPAVPGSSSTNMSPTGLANMFNQGTQGWQGQAGLGGALATGNFDPSKGIRSFMNPYTENVIGTSLGEIGRQQGLAQNQLASTAEQAGAYGGDRFGVQSAENQRNFDQLRNKTIADLYSTGHQNAVGAFQNQQGQGLQALQGGLSGLQAQQGQGWNQSQDILRNQMQSGGMQQQMMQSLIDAAKGQYGNYTGAPRSGLEVLLKSIGGMPSGIGTQTGTSQQNKGAGQALGTAMQLPMMFK